MNDNYQQTQQHRQQNNYPQQNFGIPGSGMMMPAMYGTAGGYMQPNQMMGMQQPYGPIPFGVQDLQQYQMQMAQQLEAQLIQYNKLQNLHGGFNGQFIPFPNSQQMESSVNSSSKLSQVSHSDTSRASQQTNRTNQTMMTNQTNLTNITSCKNVKKLNAQIQGQQSAYYQRQNNNIVHNQTSMDQNKESQHSGRNNKKAQNEQQIATKTGPGQNHALKQKTSNIQLNQDSNKSTKFDNPAISNLPTDPKTKPQPPSLPSPLHLSDHRKSQASQKQPQQHPAANQNIFGMQQIFPQAAPQTAMAPSALDGGMQDHQAFQGVNGFGQIDYKGRQNQQTHLRSSMQSYNNNLNQSQVSALSSCSSNYNSRAESNSISHSVSSSNISTSQQQRMIKNRVSGMQHPQQPFLPFAGPLAAQQQQNQMNPKQNQSASKKGNMMPDPQSIHVAMQATPQGHLQLQPFMQMSPGGVPFQSAGLLAQECSPQQLSQQVYSGDQQQADLQMHQQQKAKVVKKTAAMSEFNQIYKQIQNEKDRKKFLLQNAYALSQEHQGCRRLQKKIDEEMQRGNLGFCEDLLNVLIDFFNILMVDQFANYLCQKLIKIAKPAQLDRILTNIKQDFLQIATDQRGTRPLQKLLDKLYPLNQERSQLLSEAIKHNVLDLSINIHGNHVVQTCLEMLLSPAHKEPIYETVINNSLQIARDKQGCCVMETCLKSGSVQQQKRLVHEVVKNLREFIVDEYANYVVSEVITFKDPAINFEIAKIVSQNLQLYCNSKYSSSVVEILINNSNYDCQQLIYDAFMDKSNFTNKKRNAFREIMLNQFGNYAISTIIQKAFEFPNKKYIKFFIKIFRENTEYLKKINFGKKFINKIDQMVQLQQQIQAHSSTTSSGHNQTSHLQDPRQVPQPRYDKYFLATATPTASSSSFPHTKVQSLEQEHIHLEGQAETQSSQMRVSSSGEMQELAAGGGGGGANTGSRHGSGESLGIGDRHKGLGAQSNGYVASCNGHDGMREAKMHKSSKANLGSSDDVEEEDEVVASMMNTEGSTLGREDAGGDSETLPGQVASASPLVQHFNAAQGPHTNFGFYLNTTSAVTDCPSNQRKNATSYHDDQDANN